jgi:hypothetical protein
MNWRVLRGWVVVVVIVSIDVLGCAFIAQHIISGG